MVVVVSYQAQGRHTSDMFDVMGVVGGDEVSVDLSVDPLVVRLRVLVTHMFASGVALSMEE